MQWRLGPLLVEREADEPPRETLGSLSLQGLSAQEGRLRLQLGQGHKADAGLERRVAVGEVGVPVAVALLGGHGVDGAVAGIGDPDARGLQGLGLLHDGAVDGRRRAAGHVQLEAELADEGQAQDHELVAGQLRVPARGEGNGAILQRDVHEPREQAAAVGALHADHAVVVAGVSEDRLEAGLLQLAVDPPPVVREGAAARGDVELVVGQLCHREVGLHATTGVAERGVGN
mmetsp:Transcript_79397/g.224549  ORF Transcript_79397/g.224549 Transcript_79397/m.224549 type:complete len:231 (-) Transcript_79397:143-835(-)